MSPPRTRWLEEKRAELEQLNELALADLSPSRRDFIQFVATQKQGIALIPRLQRVDPWSGRAWPALDVAAFARICDDAEAGAIAVRTAAVFGASPADLDAVAAAVTAPVLRDDLCLDRRHIYHSRLHGADAVRLPAGELVVQGLRELAAVAASVHMATVIEAYDEATVGAALAVPGASVGLRSPAGDGRPDLTRIRELADAIPRHRTVLLLAEPDTLAELLPLDGLIDAAVVGDALLDAADPAAALRDFLERSA